MVKSFHLMKHLFNLFAQLKRLHIFFTKYPQGRLIWPRKPGRNSSKGLLRF
jgi:hypothetical protein